MNKDDEMDKSIRLRSESLGFKVVLLGLAFWGLYELWNYLWGTGEHNILPIFLATAGSLTQQISMRAMKQKMVAGDEEYKEGNGLHRIIIFSIVVLALVLTAGARLASLAG